MLTPPRSFQIQQPTPADLHYRPEIDGLRAFAVIPVLLYHVGVPGFSGGYVGVDVFFVISGYLITAILYRDIMAGTYTLASFYERRIRRIIPALSVVLLFVLAVAPFTLLPSEFRELPKYIASTLLFIANITLWRNTGYFGQEAEQNPLLHTWSLGVEEQFYIFAPITFALLLRYFFKLRYWVIVASALASFLMSVWFTPSNPTAAFYLLPTRAWELLIGSLIALLSVHPRRLLGHFGSSLAALVGLSFLIVSVVLFDSDTQFPGYAAALPVIGSALIIANAELTWVGRLLSFRPFVRMGLISYSLYLWHWPLVVYFRDWGYMDSALDKSAVVILSIGFSWLTWKFIETPFRRKTHFPTFRLLTLTSTFIAVIVALTALAYISDGWPSRYSIRVQALDSGREDFSPSRGKCHIGTGVGSAETFCRLGGNTPAVALWGDSHGVELAQAIADAGVPIFAITYSSCSPGLLLRYGNRPLCDEHNASVLEFLIATPSITAVVLSARYPTLDKAQPAAIAHTAEVLLAAGKKVFVIGPVPTPGINVPDYLASGGDPEFPYVGPDRVEFSSYFPANVSVILPSETFCTAGTCNMAPSGRVLLFDDHHISMSAATILARDVVPHLTSSLDAAAR